MFAGIIAMSITIELVNNASFVARWGMPESFANAEYYCVDAVGELMSSVIAAIFMIYRLITT